MSTRKWPWERTYNPATITPDDKNYMENYEVYHPKFISISDRATHLDGSARKAAINASQSVVSLVTYSGNNEIFQATGTIIKEDGTIFTSAKLVSCPTRENMVAQNLKVIVYLWNENSYEADVLAYDFYYGIAVVKIREKDVPQLKPACLRSVDDCISLELPVRDDNGFELRPNSNAYHLVPGDKVVALGRYFIKPYDLMAAPGEFCVSRIDGDFECKELFIANCEITPTGLGGPIINQYSEVIGITSCNDDVFTSFLPLNIALKWWKHNNRPRQLPRRPLLGMKMTNLYTASLQILAELNKKFPNVFVGVIVEEVIQGSSADTAGICPNDVIVECCGKPIRSFLELFDMMWDKTGSSVDLVVLRPSDGATLLPKVDILNATPQSKKRKRSKMRTRSQH